MSPLSSCREGKRSGPVQLAAVLAHPDWTAGQYADALHVSRATWYRRLEEYPILRAAWDSRLGSPTELPRGYKDADGNLDAWDDAG